ncbi:MAG: hypothetical protein IPH49_13620 [Ignavibacteria bacterium]|nr:hypothetical protein [Ignavibacteria bacterium]
MNVGIPFFMMIGLQWIAGLATLGALRVAMPRSMSIPLALLVGMFLHTVAFFGCELLNIPLSTGTLLISGAVVALLPHVWWKNVSAFYSGLLSKPTWTLTLYDMIPLGVALYVAFIATWAAWYWPVTPFDAMAGIDLVARQTVEEGTIVNRVFTDPSLAGQLSNQPFYAPFAMLLQVMFRLVGFAYGQLWVPIAAFALAWFLWSVLRELAHPFIAGVLWILYILTPEMLGYSYLVQTDHINAAFFAIGAILIWRSIVKNQQALLWLSVIMFCGACWSRTESILLVAIGVAASLPFVARAFSWRSAATYAAVAAVASLGVFAIWHVLFFNAYLPVRPSTAEQLIGFDGARFIQVVTSTFSNVVYDKGLWAGSFLLLAVVLVGNVVVTRKTGPLLPLMWIGVVFLGLWFVGTIFSAAIVEQTLRRGLFKVIPLIFVYVAGTELLQRASRSLMQWEAGRTS